MTKDGLKKPNYWGSLTQAATVRLGNYEGEEVRSARVSAVAACVRHRVALLVVLLITPLDAVDGVIAALVGRVDWSCRCSRGRCSLPALHAALLMLKGLLVGPAVLHAADLFLRLLTLFYSAQAFWCYRHLPWLLLVLQVYAPFKTLLPMVDPNDIVLGGWDISGLNMAEAMERAAVRG